VDLHGQSDHLSLLKPSRQMSMLDHFGQLDTLRNRFAEASRQLIEARKHLDDFQKGARDAAQRADLLRFQVNEIDAAALLPSELEDLTSERSRLANAGKLAELSSMAIALLQGGEEQIGAADVVNEVAHLLSQLTAVDPRLDESNQIAEGLGYQLQDLSLTIRQY